MDVSSDPIYVHIDELLLHGFQHVDGASFASSIQRELARSLDVRQVSSVGDPGSQTTIVSRGDISFPADASTARIGQGVAHFIRQWIDA